MIPRLLEKAILNGWAEFRTISHAFSSFGNLPIPNNSTVIITSIKWYPFINPIIKRASDGSITTTWRDLFRYNEYQLKIDGKKSKNFLQYRNEFDFKSFGINGGGNGVFNFDTSGILNGLSNGTENGSVTGTTNQNGNATVIENGTPPPPFTATIANQNFDNNLVTINAVTNTINLNENSNSLGAFTFNGTGLTVNLDDIINFESEEFLNFLPIQKAPIIQDVYFVCEEFIKLTVTRNCFVNNVNTIMGLLQPVANENPAPDGLKDSNVLLRAELNSPTPNTEYYWPGLIKNDGNNLVTPRKVENYIQDIDKDFSIISDIATINADLPAKFPYQTTPLIEFGIITINNKYWENIKNS